MGPPGDPFRPLRSDHVLCADQPIAMVVAETFEDARDAAALVTAVYAEEENKLYVKRGKTDVGDAEAICEAVTRPTMRSRPPSRWSNRWRYRCTERLICWSASAPSWST